MLLVLIETWSITLFQMKFQSRRVDRKDRRRVAEANKYFTLESAIALFLSFFINLFVVAVFAHGLYQKTNADVVSVFFKNYF